MVKCSLLLIVAPKRYTEMKLGIMQPYFMPYIGYFQLMAFVDQYVIFDDVNYIKRGWSARNIILVNGQKYLFNIAVEGGSQNNLYTQVVVIDDFSRLRKTLEFSYKKAPYYNETMELLNKIFTYNDRRFNFFIKNSFLVILEYLGIKTELLQSSELSNNKEYRGKDKIIDICKLLGASEYYNAIGGQELYNYQEFAGNGIKLGFIDSTLDTYPQLSQEFIPGLSIIDVLMMNSKKNVNLLLNSFKII